MNFYIILYVFFYVLNYVRGHDEDVHTIQYTVDNFDEEIPKKNNFVMFYAPWCGHCQRLAPTWEQLAEMLNEEDGNVRIAKVDCTRDTRICEDQDVTGYPTLKFFKIGETEGVRFRGTRDLPSLSNFINEQMGSESADEVKIPEPSKGLTEFTDDNFYDHVNTGNHFIKFYAPWCGHCQRLAPIWEELAQSLEFEEGANIGKIDCTQHRSVCNDFEIKGYPSLWWVENGKKIEKYQGSRTHEDLKLFVNKMLGTTAEEKEFVPEDDTKDEIQETVLSLTGDNFEHGIEKGVSFVKFFAPWCGHCKRLAPTWEELGKHFVHDNTVNIVKIDCTLEVNKQLCNDEEVDGFPSVFLYKSGKKISEYTGSRSLEDLVEFVLKHTDTHHDEL